MAARPKKPSERIAKMKITLKKGSVITVQLPGAWPCSTSDATVANATSSGNIATITAVKVGKAWLKSNPNVNMNFQFEVEVVA
jgi:hypothetical protein